MHPTQSPRRARGRRAWRVSLCLAAALGLTPLTVGCGDDGLPDAWPPLETGSSARKAWNGKVIAVPNPAFHKRFVPDAGPTDEPDTGVGR